MIPAALRWSHLRRWSGVLATFFTMQVATQALGLVAGLVAVRYSGIEEFALYTLATSVVAFFAFATDLGSTGSLAYFFQRSRHDGEAFEPIVAAVLSLRRTAFGLGAALVAVLFPLAALSEGFGLRAASLAAVAIAAGVWFQIHAAVHLLLLRLAARFGPAYRAEFEGGLVRLAGTAACAAAGLMRAWLLVMVAAAGSLASAWRAGRAARRPDDLPASADVAVQRRRVLRYLYPMLPSALYFSLQGPLTVWLASTFSGVRTLAEVGALGRLGLIVGLFSGLTGTILVPKLAALGEERLYRQRFVAFGLLVACFGTAFVLLALVAPDPFLRLLGVNYRGLEAELVLLMAGAALGLLDGYLVTVNNARSWTRWQPSTLVVLIGAQTCLIVALRLDTTLGILWFRFASSAVSVVLQTATAGAGFLRPRWVSWHP